MVLYIKLAECAGVLAAPSSHLQLTGSDFVSKDRRIKHIAFRFTPSPQRVLPFSQPTWAVNAKKGLGLLA